MLCMYTSLALRLDNIIHYRRFITRFFFPLIYIAVITPRLSYKVTGTKKKKSGLDAAHVRLRNFITVSSERGSYSVAVLHACIKKKSVKNIAASVILCFAQSTACFQHNSASSLNPTDKKHKYFPWPPNSELIAHWAGEKQCVCVTKQSHLGQLADVDLEVSSTVSVHTD